MTDQSSLYGYFLDAGIGIAAPHVSLIAPLYLAGEGKTLALSTLEATAEAIVSEGLASADELNGALANWRHSWPILAAL